MLPEELNIKHYQLGVLFRYGEEIPPNQLYQLLAIPHHELEQDLYEILKYGSQTQEFYMEDLKSGRITQAEKGFMFHAIQLLAEIQATDTLHDIGYLLTNGWAPYQFWFGEFRSFWAKEPLYLLGRHDLGKLEEIYMNALGHLFPRAAAIMAAAKVGLVAPDRIPEVEKLFLHSFDSLQAYTEKLFGTPREDELALFTSIFPVLLEEAAKLKLAPVFDRAEAMIVQTGREPGMSLADVREKRKGIAFDSPPAKEKVPDILERYRELTLDFLPNTDQNPTPQAPFTQKWNRLNRGPVRKPEKVGRNEPCPCGSGKKYKKCCGK